MTKLATAEEELVLAAGHGLPLERWIKAASDMIVRLCNREFAKARYVEAMPGTSGTELVLEGRPLLTVEGVLINDLDCTDYIITSYEPSILYRGNGWPEIVAYATGLTDNPLAIDLENIIVTYVAGYTMPNDPVPNLPSNYEQACLLLVRQLKLAQGKDGAVTSERVGGLAVTYSERSRIIVPEVYELLGLEVPL